jgi:hypothetical protein
MIAHRILDDFQKPVRRLETRHRRPVEPQRLGQFVVEHRLVGYRQHRQGHQARRSAGPTADEIQVRRNRKTASALGIEVPLDLLLADEVME